MSLPTRLGRLERVDRLGSGGFATVWLYHDAELDSDVAVKALAENWSQRLDVRERFLEEARILRRADSDHIVRVYDIGEVDGTPYFVMTYADLGSLARPLEPGLPLPVPRVVDLVSQAGAGLAVLHEHGVVHRDIKPQNLLLRSGGSAGDRLLVADLGVAKAMLHASGLTQVVGTPAYMAPEQATGGGIDARADVHALAAVAYQMLTGRLARDGTIAELAHASLPLAPSRIEPSLPAEVDEVLLRSLDPAPDARYSSIEAFVDAFRSALPVTGATPPAAARVTRYQTPDTTYAPLPTAPTRRRLPVLLTLICLLVFAAAFGAAYAVTSCQPSRGPPIVDERPIIGHAESVELVGNALELPGGRGRSRGRGLAGLAGDRSLRRGATGSSRTPEPATSPLPRSCHGVRPALRGVEGVGTIQAERRRRRRGQQPTRRGGGNSSPWPVRPRAPTSRSSSESRWRGR